MGKRFHLTSTQVIVLGFALLIILGGALLALPVSWQSGRHISPLDAMFTATSATCVTGLVTVDVGSTFSVFGKVVIALLIQIGGLGFMSIATVFYIAFRRKISLREKMVLQESFSETDGVVELVKKVLLMTLGFEGVGAVALMTRFIPQYGAKGIAYGVFHSVSAFCNAGFDILGTQGNRFSSLAGYASDPVVCLTVSLLVIAGGLGFAVIGETITKRKFSKMTLHTKAVLIVTGALLVIGFAGTAILEWNNPRTMGDKGTAAKLLMAFFQSVTARTAGFSTMDQGGMGLGAKVLTVILMFIGASPASTGGGVKTTTLFIMVIMLISIIRGKEDFVVFKRRIAKSTVFRAFAIMTLAVITVVISSVVLYAVEMNNPLMHVTFRDIVYEATSAFGTVGMSCGLTPFLGTASKWILMLLMFAGRVGVMTVTFAMVKLQNKPKPAIKYPEDKLMVG